jgi:Flp pilus assembly protein TadD
MGKSFWCILWVGAAWSQTPVLTPQQVLDQARSELRGQRDVYVRVIPGEPAPQLGTDRPTGEAVSVTHLRHAIPGSAKKAFLKGQKFTQSGDHQNAAKELEKAVAKDPGFAEARNMLGVLYERLGRTEEARKCFEQAVELDPNAWEAHYNLGLALMQANDLSGAEQRIKRALELSPANPTVHLFLGYLLFLHADTRTAGIEHVRYAARSLPAAQQFLEILEPKSK